MPPKQKQNAPGTSKVKEDKTFGMKNKNKSSKVKQQVEQIQKQASQAGKSKEVLAKEREKELRAKEKAEEEKRKKEEAQLFKPAQTQKVPFGVDPKSVLCAFFKAGNCDKGSKCKFSHDLGVERKTEKKSLYMDEREEKAEDTMDKWDEEKLRTVVLSKAGNPRTTTDIVCKFFIEAVETGKYGWFWECPNGQQCLYRHALPPGFVLKSQKKAMDEAAKANTITIEEFLEVERHKLGPNLTPVTKESFAKWKQSRLDKKDVEMEAIRRAKTQQAAAGKSNGMSGRDLFSYNPEWFEQDDADEEEEEWDLNQYRHAAEEEVPSNVQQELHDLRVDDEREGGSDDEEKDETS